MYKPIGPIEVPSMKEVLLGVRGGPIEVGVVKHLEEEESVMAVNLGIPISEVIGFRRSHVLYRLNDRPIKLRHNGDKADLEVYVDTFTFVQESEVLKSDFEEYPPEDPFNRDWGEGSYYQRFTMGYVYEGVVVERASSVIWDGRYGLCVNRRLEEVDSGERVTGVRGRIREQLKNPGMPRRTFSVGNEGITRDISKFSPAINTEEYLNEIDRWLGLHYNSVAIPELPRSSEPLTPVYKGILEDTKEYTKVVAAVLEGDYFVEWVGLVRPRGVE